MPKKKVDYDAIVESIFFANYESGADSVEWTRQEILDTADALDMEPPKNPGDLVSSYRFRRQLPQKIKDAAPTGKVWILRLVGRSKYRFVAIDPEYQYVLPSPHLARIKIPDATPGIIAANALSDEQALLAKVRYNRLLDIFTGVTCYSLQSHLRTTVKTIGSTQIETDELYVGIDRRGAQYSLPVQAKGGRDKLSIVQIEQDYAMCIEKFPALICRPVAAQFIGDDIVAMFAFDSDADGSIVLANERHYQLVAHTELTAEELEAYRESALEPDSE